MSRWGLTVVIPSTAHPLTNSALTLREARHDQATLTWTLPLKLPYKNQLTPSPGPHAWRRFKAIKETWAKAFYALPDRAPLRATGPRAIKVTRILGPRERPFDTANLIYGLASIIDHLVHAGYLVDDTERWLFLERPEQRKAGASDPPGPATIIRLRPLEALEAERIYGSTLPRKAP